jgi:hypothetical protein
MKGKEVKAILLSPTVAAICFAVSIGISSATFAQSEKEVVSIFKTKINGLDKCTSKTRWFLRDIKYDVKKTESLVIPIQGELTFTAIESGTDGKPDLDNPHSRFPVRVKLYWSGDDRHWVVETLLSKFYSIDRENPWTEPEKDRGWRYAKRGGYLMEDLVTALRNHFSSTKR